MEVVEEGGESDYGIDSEEVNDEHLCEKEESFFSNDNMSINNLQRESDSNTAEMIEQDGEIIKKEGETERVVQYEDNNEQNDTIVDKYRAHSKCFNKDGRNFINYKFVINI